MFFYNIFLIFFKVAIYAASPFNRKAARMISGRKNGFRELEKAVGDGGRIIWVHCASLGEFEQGRPVIEEMKKSAINHKILLTFFSPSGYEAKKDYDGADWVFYLPLDGSRNARRFLEIVKPVLVIFVKYEFWYYYLKKIKYRNIPLLLVSALFRKDMMFFRWYGALARKMLSRFDHLFVQNPSSKALMENIGLGTITTVSGDTRFDRVNEIAATAASIPVIEDFLGNSKAIIAGSTWQEDDLLLSQLEPLRRQYALKLIIAPHEIEEKKLQALGELFPGSTRYSQWEKKKNETAGCLIIDNIGMLSRLYRYAFITYVGGGHRDSGVHNVLEAAVFGKPVLFGPFYKKYSEAVELVASTGGIPVSSGSEAEKVITVFLQDQQEYNRVCEAAALFVRSNLGATGKIVAYIQEKRLLTS